VNKTKEIVLTYNSVLLFSLFGAIIANFAMLTFM
jgi:hypothetical protein